ncbi:TrbI/VirB10 family protein [Azospirillum doebereinerae]
MSAPETSPLSDPLARRRVVVSGPHRLRILLVSVAVIGLGLAAYMIGRSQGAGGVGKQPILFDRRLPEGKLPSYADLASPPTPAPRVEVPTPAPVMAKPPMRGPAKEDDLRKRAMEAGVGGWSRKDAEDVKSSNVNDRSQFVAGGSACFVPPGTPISAQTVNRVVTERGGIVMARVTRDVWDAGFSCLAVPAGSLVTMDVGGSVTKGQRRIDIVRPVITRPWPRNDAVQPAAVGADASGAGGVAGTVEVPWFETGLLIAASAAVDIGVAALTGGGSLIGGILGHSMDRPLDKAAKDGLDRAPVITMEAGEQLLLLLRGGLQADDFRNW